MELSWWSDFFAVFGLALTAIGAGLTARSVILTEAEAATIGVSRYAPETHEQALQLPHVQSLLKSSRGAKRGLVIISVGTVLQIVVPLFRLFL